MPTMKILPTVIAGAIETVTSPAALPPTEIEGAIRYSQSDDTLYTYDGAAWTPVAGGGGSGIDQLTGDVTAGPGSGSQAATVVTVGGQTAANVAAGAVLANASTSANTPSTIVRRDASGNFAAGTITASLTGHASLDILLTEKGANNGVATLDSGGKIPGSQLPNSVMDFLGNWDALTNSPTLADGSGSAGDVYYVNVAGTQDLGSGSQTFAVGDWCVYNGTIWQKSLNSVSVVSVNGQTGTVVLDTDDVNEGVTNLYFTPTRAQAASSATAPITYSGGVIAIPVSTNAVNGYLSAADHTTFAAKVGPSRNIATSAPLTGGGNLSADLTLGIPVASNVADGYLSAADHITFSASAANAVTSLTGDITGTGPGATATTLASVGTPGTYVKVTTDAKGRVTSGSASPLGISDGGSGQTTANAALNAFLPDQTGNSGKVLQTDGTDTSWQTVSSGSNSAAYSTPSTDVTLTNADNRIQVFAPSADIAVNLPTTGVLAGDIWQITNSLSAFRIQVKASGGNNVDLIFPGTLKLMATVNSPTLETDWYQLEPVEVANIPFTGSGSWTVNTFYVANYSRKGKYITIAYQLNMSGAPDAATTLSLNPPAGLTEWADGTAGYSFADFATTFGLGTIRAGGNTANLYITYVGATGWTPYYSTVNAPTNTVQLQNIIQDGIPYALSSGNILQFTWTYPVTEFA